MEAKLLQEDMERCYNVFETFQGRIATRFGRVGELNPFYGRSRGRDATRNQICGKKVFRMMRAVVEIDGKRYPSIAEASRSFLSFFSSGHARKTNLLSYLLEHVLILQILWKRVFNC
jgi:hypothetical protein